LGVSTTPTFIEGIVGVGFGIVNLAYGIGAFIMARALLRAKSWAWTRTLISAVIGIILGIASFIVGRDYTLHYLFYISTLPIIITINAGIIFYLYRRL
jgi:hypothetical protein